MTNSVPALAAWGFAAGAALVFFAERLPRLRKDVYSKLPIIGQYSGLGLLKGNKWTSMSFGGSHIIVDSSFHLRPAIQIRHICRGIARQESRALIAIPGLSKSPARYTA